MITKYEKANKGKLLVAVLALFVVLAGAAVVFSDSEVNADNTKVSSEAQLVEELAKEDVTQVTVSTTLYISGNVDLDGKTLNITANQVRINGGSIYNGTINETSSNLAIYSGTISDIEFTSYRMAISVSPSINGDITISNCTFNEVQDQQAAVYCETAGNYDITIEDCNFEGVNAQGDINFDARDGNGQTMISVIGSDSVSMGIARGTLDAGTNLDVSNVNITEVKIDSDAGLNIPSNTTFTAEKITGEGTLTVQAGAVLNAAVSVIKYTDNNKYMDIGTSIDAVDTELQISGNAVVSSSLVIPEGKTLRILDGGVVDLRGMTITVEGTLVVEAGGIIKSNGTGGIILLTQGGTFTNEGTIGYGMVPVTISADNASVSDRTYAGTGSVSMQNVSGLTFGFANTGELTKGLATYILTVSGDLAAIDGGDSQITLKGVRIVGDLSIGNDVDVIADNIANAATVMNGATVNVDGTLTTNGNLTMVNGSTINVNGKVIGAIIAQTGTYTPGNKETAPAGTSSIKLSEGADYIAGVTLTVGQYSYSETEDGVTTAYIDQRLYISGNADIVSDATEPKFTISIVNSAETGKVGLSYIASDATLVLDDGISVNAGGTVVLGQVQYPDKTSNKIQEFIGTEYTIAESASNKTAYITAFENAYANIASAENTTLDVYGDLKISIDVSLAEKQKINFERNTTVTIDEDATVEVASGASIGKVSDVQGVLVKYKGASCQTPGNYVVEKTTDTYTQWSGLGPALAGAQAGDVIDIKKSGSTTGNVSVPAGVTVNVAAGATLDIGGDLTIAETAKVTNKGTIRMIGANSEISVAGEFDVGTTQFGSIADDVFTKDTTNTDGKNAFESTGNAILGSTINNDLTAFIVGAVYKDADMRNILTSVANATAAVAERDVAQTVTVYGNVNDKTDVTVAANTTLTLNAGAQVTLGNVTLAIGETSGAQITFGSKSVLTAAVTAMVGVAGSETAATIDLSKANASITAHYALSSDNVRSNYLYIGGTLVGKATISAGQVNVAANGLTADGKDNVLTVASGATLAVDKIGNSAPTLTAGSSSDKASVVVSGTIQFNGGALAETSNQIIDVTGNMIVGDSTNIEVDGTLNVTGTVTVSTTADKQGTLTVNGILVVGDKPTDLGANGTIVGAVETETGAYVKVYAGSSVADALIDVKAGESEADSTAFYVNGNLYMTVYASYDDVTFSTVLGAEKFALTGYDMSKATTATGDKYPWYTNEELTGDNVPTGTAIGAEGYESVYYKATAIAKAFTVSVGSGISLYVDDVRITGNTVDLTVGEHTVVATVNPGYTGDVTISFNGQTVTGGKITVTADMISDAYTGDRVISATGNISYDTGSAGSTSDDGMGIVEILLVILVVVVVILAIIVVLRMMRS